MVSNPFFNDANIPAESLLTLTANMIDLGLAYRILYLLASNTHTSMAVLRFIRSSCQFIFNQIDLLTFNTGKLADIPGTLGFVMICLGEVATGTGDRVVMIRDDGDCEV